jgi:hypothetical protein
MPVVFRNDKHLADPITNVQPYLLSLPFLSGSTLDSRSLYLLVVHPYLHLPYLLEQSYRSISRGGGTDRPPPF